MVRGAPKALHQALRHEIWRLVLLAAAGAAVGHYWWNSIGFGVGFGLALYIARQLWLLRGIARWLAAPRQHELPDIGGAWGEVYDRLYALQRRNDQRKRRLARIVAEFQASTAALPDAAVVLSPRGDIVWFNQAAQTLIGLRMPQDHGQRIVNLLRHPRFTRYMEGHDFIGDVEAPSPVDAGRTLSLRIVPYGDGQRLLIARDVSETRRLDRMRRDFVANASHELRTPLTVLRGYVEMMGSEAQSEGPLAPWRAPLHEMAAQTVRMETLINDLLRLARLEGDSSAQRAQPVDMPSLCERCVEQARALSEGRHAISADIDPQLWLHGRETDLQSIVANLLSNAVRYTPEGGDIALTWREEGDGAVLSVTDSGIGIAEPDIPRLTERFYRVDIGRSRVSGGTGLGLAIAKHALEQHDARLTISSRPGQGSRFNCHFPVQRLHRQRG